jgi:hypothetical protein
LDLETNVIVESVYVGFIKNKLISDTNMQESDLTVMILSSTLSKKNIKIQKFK